ncbi:hypothetical protein Z517_06106 [Fonsecaea pedrosoi CBS 271.37]|uniref:Mid2 domain-containing protein n=1 Tax=Fonsecaea pedrosoi CBS 271.37 TaxID=1442368 RepID=A0A0D2H4H1_9EURO|nr:uncharacterized protein Z517_06106 [Fonsecaea pedrosoi CBS 271.37]KIW79494.1 hypothetical protein Z517_06106 [Fonsecaea pedrosoi CBS 271.37]
MSFDRSSQLQRSLLLFYAFLVVLLPQFVCGDGVGLPPYDAEYIYQTSLQPRATTSAPAPKDTCGFLSGDYATTCRDYTSSETCDPDISSCTTTEEPPNTLDCSSRAPYCGQLLLEGGSTAWICTTKKNYIMTVLRASISITVVETGSTIMATSSAAPSAASATGRTSTATRFTPSFPATPRQPASESIGPALFGGLAIGSIAIMAAVTVASILFIRHKRHTQYQSVSQSDPIRLRTGK